MHTAAAIHYRLGCRIAQPLQRCRLMLSWHIPACSCSGGPGCHRRRSSSVPCLYGMRTWPTVPVSLVVQYCGAKMQVSSTHPGRSQAPAAAVCSRQCLGFASRCCCFRGRLTVPSCLALMEAHMHMQVLCSAAAAPLTQPQRALIQTALHRSRGSQQQVFVVGSPADIARYPQPMFCQPLHLLGVAE